MKEYFPQDDLLFFFISNFFFLISYSVPAKQWEVRDMLIKLVERTLFQSRHHFSA